ncbi:MAG TPA: diacylglycerol kinase family protein [Gemmatimonas sp.]|nr:diacylglycerol kinase family protein [Gemmatimonas sp.]
MSAIHLVVNPRAGGGTGARRVHDARDALAAVGDVIVRETLRAGDETRLAVEAHQQGARALAVLGGDGTVSNAARGLLQQRSAVPIAVLAAGTGNDFAKSFGAPVHDYKAMAALLGSGCTRTIDAGCVDDVTFVGAAGFGFDVHVLAKLAARRGSTGRATYAVTALGALRTYRGFEVRVEGHTGTGDAMSSRLLLLVFANGRYFGGAFCIAPDASLHDGALDMIRIADAPTARRVSLLARAVGGAHIRCPEVSTVRNTEYIVTFSEPPRFETDGELHLASDSTVRVRSLPNALRVVAPQATP